MAAMFEQKEREANFTKVIELLKTAEEVAMESAEFCEFNCVLSEIAEALDNIRARLVAFSNFNKDCIPFVGIIDNTKFKQERLINSR